MKEGFNRLDGACIKLVALGNVQIFSTHLSKDIQVMGC